MIRKMEQHPKSVLRPGTVLLFLYRLHKRITFSQEAD